MVVEQATALAAARQIAPELSERALAGERLGTLPPALVETARRAGLFTLAMPRLLGGLELDPATVVETLEELSRADGSAGWTIMIGNATAFLAWLDPSVARDLLGDRTDVIIAGSFAPNGRLTPSAGGLQLDGRWSFASGSLHADLFFGGGFVMDGPAPRVLPGRGPDWRLAFYPAADGNVIENWDVAGLRGTGSHDIAATRVQIPEERTIAPFFELARHDGPLWRLPFFTLIGAMIVAVPLGIARRALDEFAQLAPAKIRVPGPGPIAEDGDIQVAVTRAEGGVQAARAFVFDALGALWDSALAGDVPSVEQRARFLLANQQAMRASADAVNTVFGLAGAGALHSGNPLQRCWRDVHAAAAHIYFSPAAQKRYAKARLGIEQQTFWF